MASPSDSPTHVFTDRYGAADVVRSWEGLHRGRYLHLGAWLSTDNGDTAQAVLERVRMQHSLP